MERTGKPSRAVEPIPDVDCSSPNSGGFSMKGILLWLIGIPIPIIILIYLLF